MSDSAETPAAPCRCHQGFAYVTRWHEGHCCFFPASQTCHAREVADWEAERDVRLGLATRGAAQRVRITATTGTED